MLLERYYDDALAQASYLIGCERSHEAIVIDPNRDIERYVRAAAAHRLIIRYVTETHIHADFLSGARELAELARATLLLSGHGGTDWSYRFADRDDIRLVRDRESLNVGAVRVQVVHTPGHTPEHISLLVTDTAVGDRPLGMATGDFLFVGDVGRPDLLERAANVADTMEQSARQLFRSLRGLIDLPDYLQIWPGHGAGSACGKALGAVPQSTLGYERLYNPALQQPSETDFVRWVLADQPEPPPYFATMKQLNRDGPPPRPARAVVAVDIAELESAAATHWIVDVRGSAEFAKEHLSGTINIPASNKFPTYAGTVLSYDKPILLVAKSADQAAAVARHLALIGMDRVDGWISAGALEQARQSPHGLSSVRAVDPRGLAARLDKNGPRVIDVRGRTEWNEGHLPNATHVYLGELQERMGELRRNEPIVVHCETGTRSSIAASLLMASGFTDVSNLVGGVAAWRKLGLPVVAER
jgi:hydroxyacylglutathione hydrolase